MKNKEEFSNDIEQYKKTSFFAKIPSWVKILLLKYWAAGAAFYFFGMAAGFIWYGSNALDSSFFLLIMLILGFALITEYIVKQVVRLMRTSRDNTYYYNMINLKGTKSFFLNLGYSVLVVVPCFFLFSWLGEMGWNLTIWGVPGIEPFSFALAVTFVDFIYLCIKNAIMNEYNKRKFAETTRKGKDEDL